MMKNMKAHTSLLPGQKGTKRLQEQYGRALLCVRYRNDELRGVRLKTVELIVEERPLRTAIRYRNEDIVSLVVSYTEKSLRDKLKAAGANIIGKANRRLASENRIPAVLYGPGRDTISLSVDRHDFELLMAHHSSGSTVVEMEVEGEKKPIHAMIREMQTSPVKGTILHIDFLAVAMNKPVHAVVALHLVNDPAGVKAGGVLTTNLHEINVEAKPGDLPEFIEVDVSSLEVGDSVHVGQIEVPAGVTLLDDPETVVASVQAPRVEVEAEVAEAEVEPEVIGEKAEEE